METVPTMGRLTNWVRDIDKDSETQSERERGGGGGGQKDIKTLKQRDHGEKNKGLIQQPFSPSLSLSLSHTHMHTLLKVGSLCLVVKRPSHVICSPRWTSEVRGIQPREETVHDTQVQAGKEKEKHKYVHRKSK